MKKILLALTLAEWMWLRNAKEEFGKLKEKGLPKTYKYKKIK